MKQIFSLAFSAIMVAVAAPASAQCPPDKEMPHWEFKNGACLPSCGALSTIVNAETISRGESCSRFGEAPAGQARDAQYCCIKGNGQTRPDNDRPNRPGRPGNDDDRPNRPGRPGDGRPGDGRPGDGRPGNGGGHGPGPDRPVVVKRELIRISSFEHVPNDVCLSLPPGFIDYFSETNRPRVIVESGIDFCPDRNYWFGLPSCTGNVERPDDSSVFAWRGSSASATLGNKGETKSVSVTSNEAQITTTWYDANASIFRPTCYEPERQYNLRVTRIEREFVNGREIDRDMDRSSVVVQGNLMKREPLWKSNVSESRTGRTSVSKFDISAEAYETQLDRNFTLEVNHTAGSQPSVRFFADKYFSHSATVTPYEDVNDFGIAVSTQISPILSPMAAISAAKETPKKTKTLPITIVDNEINELVRMDPKTETQYVLHIQLKNDGNFSNPTLIEDLRVVIPNPENKSSLTVDVEDVVAASGQSLGLKRKDHNYLIYFSVESERTNSKFVRGKSQISPKVEMKLKRG